MLIQSKHSVDDKRASPSFGSLLVDPIFHCNAEALHKTVQVNGNVRESC